MIIVLNVVNQMKILGNQNQPVLVKRDTTKIKNKGNVKNVNNIAKNVKKETNARNVRKDTHVMVMNVKLVNLIIKPKV